MNEELFYKVHNAMPHSSTSWILFISGFTGTHEVWNAVVDYLKQQANISILLVDNLGSGNSPQPKGNYTTDLMASKIFETVDKLGIQEITIVGHSMGGCIAQQMALLRPQLVKRLFLISTFANLISDNICKSFLESRYEMLRNNIDKEIIAKTAIPSIFGNKFLDSKNNMSIAIGRIVNNTQTLNGMFGQLNACITHDVLAKLSLINCPTTIITGEDDILVHPKHSKILLKIPQSNLISIPDVAHMVPLECSMDLAEIIAANYLL